MQEDEKIFYSTHNNFRIKENIKKEDTPIGHQGHSLSIPNEFVPRLKPKRPPDFKNIPGVICFRHGCINLNQKNTHITEQNNKLRVSFSFDEEYNNYETKETENEEDCLKILRKSLTNQRKSTFDERKTKDDSSLNFTSKHLIQYSSILKVAIKINRRHLSSDFSSFINFY